MPTYMHVENIYLFMYNYMRWWRFLEPSPFCSLTFCSLSEEILEKGAYALREALRVNQSLRKLEWVQLLTSYTCTRVVLWDCTSLITYILDLWWWIWWELSICDHARAYINLHCVTISHMLNTFVKILISIFLFFVLWYSAASATTISQLMVCVH